MVKLKKAVAPFSTSWFNFYNSTMFNKFLLSITLIMWSLFAYAQTSITVTVKDYDSKDPIQGASVRLGTSATKTNDQGVAQIEVNENLPKQLVIDHLSYRRYREEIRSVSNESITIYLQPQIIIADEVFVTGIRAQENAATTFTNLSKKDLENKNLGQDIPYLLTQTPSLVAFSDAGAGVGYTGIRIRGSDNTRINVTIDGIPLNNAESMGSFFVNLPDFASSVENIQIQRGIGTSTNGAGAFGASLNIQSDKVQENPYAELNNSFGSFKTLKNTLKVGTGLIEGKYAFNARLSQIKSDGYMDRAFSDLKSFYVDGGIYTPKNILKATVFSGKERTYQAWNGVPEELLQSNRTFNEFEYDDQTDNYTQTHHYLHYSHFLNSRWTFNTALHYTKGAGYYNEYKSDQKLEDYLLAPIIIGDSTISHTDLVRKRWLDNHFYGLTYGAQFTPNNQLNIHLGGAYNEYIGDHFGEITWANYASNHKLGDHYYFNDAKKTDFNIYGKINYQVGKFLLNADLQYRNIYYRFEGYDRNLELTDQVARHDFFNPKAGVTYFLNPNSNFYASYAYASKEPIRNDYTESTQASRPVPEKMHNLEGGYRLSSQAFAFGINGYAMLYKDQLILTGQINDVGAYTRMNVRDSYRIGVELDARWKIAKNLDWNASVALSDNKIKNFTEYIDLYDYSDQEELFYKSTHIALSPALVASNSFSYQLGEQFSLDLISKAVSRQFLDNTSSKQRSIDGFDVHDINVNYSFSLPGIKAVTANLLVANIFNKKYESNGYTFGYINETGERESFNYYFPQATTNFLLGLNLKF